MPGDLTLVIFEMLKTRFDCYNNKIFYVKRFKPKIFQIMQKLS